MYKTTVQKLNLAKAQYHAQRKAASRRKIKWLFSFDEWIMWWIKSLGPDWQRKRGRKSHQFCMARIGDKGPYAIWNVTCCLSRQNCQDRTANGTDGFTGTRSHPGEKNPKAKLTAQQAADVFNALGSYSQISRRYKIGISQVHAIKKRKSWGHVTNHLSNVL